jgi:hypothetical protein
MMITVFDNSAIFFFSYLKKYKRNWNLSLLINFNGKIILSNSPTTDNVIENPIGGVNDI